MTYGHLQADCLYTGISSGPNARCRVWEAFTFYLLLHGSRVVGVSQTLWHGTRSGITELLQEGATYIPLGGHHIGHQPTF